MANPFVPADEIVQEAKDLLEGNDEEMGTLSRGGRGGGGGVGGGRRGGRPPGPGSKARGGRCRECGADTQWWNPDTKKWTCNNCLGKKGWKFDHDSGVWIFVGPLKPGANGIPELPEEDTAEKPKPKPADLDADGKVTDDELSMYMRLIP